jgi:hypothetical protein
MHEAAKRRQKKIKIPIFWTISFYSISLERDSKWKYPYKGQFTFTDLYFLSVWNASKFAQASFSYLHSELRHMTWANIRAFEVPGGGGGGGAEGDMKIETLRRVKKRLWFSDVQ